MLVLCHEILDGVVLAIEGVVELEITRRFRLLHRSVEVVELLGIISEHRAELRIGRVELIIRDLEHLVHLLFDFDALLQKQRFRGVALHRLKLDKLVEFGR